MTRSKLDLATILVKLRGSDEDPAVLAKEMSLMKLCYEIQRVEEDNQAGEPETPVEAPKEEAPVEAPKEEPKEELTAEEKQVVKELKVPAKTSTEKRNKHILSWLLDSSSDDED